MRISKKFHGHLSFAHWSWCRLQYLHRLARIKTTMCRKPPASPDPDHDVQEAEVRITSFSLTAQGLKKLEVELEAIEHEVEIAREARGLSKITRS